MVTDREVNLLLGESQKKLDKMREYGKLGLPIKRMDFVDGQQKWFYSIFIEESLMGKDGALEFFVNLWW